MTGKSSGNLVLFCDEKFNINSLKKYLSNSESTYINDLLKTSDLKKNLFVYELNSNSEVWLKSDTHKTDTSPIRLSNNRFYNENMVFVSEEKTEDTLIHRYKNCQPINEYGHNILIEQFIPLSKVDRSIEYYNIENSKDCKLGQILKTPYKYSLNHERLNE